MTSKFKRPCPNCREYGNHFVPPSLGEPGFYICAASKLPSAPSPAPKCGKPAELMIPRLGVSRACVLEPGHEGDCRGGGNCFKHGEYVGPECPQWPDCAKPPFTAQQIESMKAAPSPAEETASEYVCPVCEYNMTPYKPADYNICPQCGTEFGVSDAYASHDDLRAAWIEDGRKFWSKRLPEPVSPEVLGTCADICGPHTEGSHPHCDMWAPSAPEAAAAEWYECSKCGAGISSKRKGLQRCITGGYCDPKSAAPIAPAAEELIQELVEALRKIEQETIDHVAVKIARAALTRAEEYRKGAK